MAWTTFHFHQQWMSILAAQHPCQHLVLSVFFILVILISMSRCLGVALICIFLRLIDVEHIYSHVVNFGEVSVPLFGPFSNWVIFFLLNFENSVYIKFFIYPGYKNFVGYVIWKSFFPDCSFSFHLFNSIFCSFCCQKTKQTKTFSGF